MNILTLKRVTGEDSKVHFEVIYKDNNKDESRSAIKTLSIECASDGGEKLEKVLIEVNRGRKTQQDIEDVIFTIIKERPIEKLTNAINLANKDNVTSISAKIKLVNESELYIGEHQVDAVLATQVINLVEARAKDSKLVSNDEWRSLINFTEALYENISESVRNQLYSWLTYQIRNGRLTITTEGKFLGYKGCSEHNGIPSSIHSGPAIVNGVPMNGHIPNAPDSIIEMPREDVNSDPTQTCSTGLHVGSYKYANSFGDQVLLVEVDPRDVISVPNDYDGQKLRACKYKVIKEVKSELEDFTLNFEETPLDKNDSKRVIEYLTQNNNKRVYTDFEVINRDEQTMTIKTKEGEYRKLINLNIISDTTSNNASKVSEDIQLDDLYEGLVIKKMSYLSSSEQKTVDLLDVLVVDRKENSIVVNIPNKGYRTILFHKLTSIEI